MNHSLGWNAPVGFSFMDCANIGNWSLHGRMLSKTEITSTSLWLNLIKGKKKWCETAGIFMLLIDKRFILKMSPFQIIFIFHYYRNGLHLSQWRREKLTHVVLWKAVCSWLHHSYLDEWWLIELLEWKRIPTHK